MDIEKVVFTRYHCGEEPYIELFCDDGFIIKQDYVTKDIIEKIIMTEEQKNEFNNIKQSIEDIEVEDNNEKQILTILNRIPLKD